MGKIEKNPVVAGEVEAYLQSGIKKIEIIGSRRMERKSEALDYQNAPEIRKMLKSIKF